MQPIRLIAGDRALQLITLAFLLHGSFAASLVPYRSLLGVEWFGLSDGMFSLVFACGSMLSLFCAIGVGVLTDRTGRRRNAARLASCSGVCGAALVFFVDQTWAFVVAHILFFPVGMTLFSQLFTLARLAASVHPPEVRTGLLSAIRAAFAVPFVIVLPIWSVVLSAGVPLIWVYGVCAAAELMTLTLFVLAWPADGRTRWKDAPSGLTLLAALRELSEPRVVGRSVMVVLVLSGVQIYLILVGLILTGFEGRDAGDVAIFAGAVAGLEIPFMLMLSGPLQRFGQVRVIAFGALIYAAFVALLPLLGPLPVVWALPILGALGGAVILTVPNAYLQDLMDARPGAGGSLIALCNLAAQLLAAALFAAGTAVSGYGLVAWIGAAVVGAGGVGLALRGAPQRA